MTYSPEATRVLLHHMGFHLSKSGKANYTDRHEDEDVKELRKEYCRMMSELEDAGLVLHRMPTEEEKKAFMALPEALRPWVLWWQDESAFQARPYEQCQWIEVGKQVMASKGTGAHIMVSAWVSVLEGEPYSRGACHLAHAVLLRRPGGQVEEWNQHRQVGRH